jgi:3'(2'), 5'-bisphosphate nucleotidase
MSEETQAFVHDKQKEYKEVNLVSSGSSIKICLVAEGVADAYPRYAPTMEWDTAAGDAIARAAGCQMTNAQDGLPLEYNKENLLNPWFLVSAK